MKLPHLTQPVLLDKGQAHVVHQALYFVRRELLHRDPHSQRWTTTEALSLKPLNRVLLRLLKLAERDDLPVHVVLSTSRRAKRRPPKPHKLKLEYDELAIMRLYYARMLATTADDEVAQLVLAGALAKFHQPSLNLEQHIILPSPSGPGAQTTLL